MRTMLTQLILAKFWRDIQSCQHKAYKLYIIFNLPINFKRMLEKNPEQRFSINEVDKAIRSINLKTNKTNLKSQDIFEGFFNL